MFDNEIDWVKAHLEAHPGRSDRREAYARRVCKVPDVLRIQGRAQAIGSRVSPEQSGANSKIQASVQVRRVSLGDAVTVHENAQDRSQGGSK